MIVTFSYRIYDSFGDCMKSGRVNSTQCNSEEQAKYFFESKCKRDIPRFYSVEFFNISNDTKAVDNKEVDDLFNKLFSGFNKK